MSQTPNGALTGMPGPGRVRRSKGLWDSIGPWFAIASFAVNIGLGFYWYYGSEKAPLLSYKVSPVVTELRRPDFDDGLQFSYRGAPLKADNITAFQIAIWNRGSQSIRADNLLQPLQLDLADGAGILSVRIKEATRKVCDFRLANGNDFMARGMPGIEASDEANLEAGKCGFRFRILEPGDGALIQVIYLGSAGQQVSVDGVIEGQKGIAAVEGERAGNSYVKWLGVICPALLFAISVLFQQPIAERRMGPARAKVWARAFLVFFFVAELALVLLPSQWSINSPFGW
jgi:hypothetical protein